MMRMAKADADDFNTAFTLHKILQAAHEGSFLPMSEDDDWEDFDEENKDHLRKFFDQVIAALDNNPSGLMRVIGGAHTLLAESNEIVDPDKSYIDMHPRFYIIEQQAADWLAALIEARRLVVNHEYDDAIDLLCEVIKGAEECEVIKGAEECA